MLMFIFHAYTRFMLDLIEVGTSPHPHPATHGSILMGGWVGVRAGYGYET